MSKTIDAARNMNNSETALILAETIKKDRCLNDLFKDMVYNKIQMRHLIHVANLIYWEKALLMLL